MTKENRDKPPMVVIYYEGELTNTIISSTNCLVESQQQILYLFQKIWTQLIKKKIPPFIILNYFNALGVTSTIIHTNKITHLSLENITDKKLIEEWEKVMKV